MSKTTSKTTEIHGPWRFRLRRDVDETGTSGTEFRSTGIYDTIAALLKIHGHHGGTVLEWLDAIPTDAFKRGLVDCIQDDCENCAFASIGGKEARGNPQAPHYISEWDRAEYLRGYIAEARWMYGDDWATCSFGWAPAITIGANQ